MRIGSHYRQFWYPEPQPLLYVTVWTISMKKRQKLVHSINGNIDNDDGDILDHKYGNGRVLPGSSKRRPIEDKLSTPKKQKITPSDKKRSSPTIETKWRIITLSENAGWGNHRIARELNIDRSVIIRLLKKYKATGTIENRDRSGRPKKTTPETDRYIKIVSLKNRFLTASEIAADLKNDGVVNVSHDTVNRRLNFVGLNGRVAKKKPALSETNRIKRLKFAREHIHWGNAEWDSVLWSDESPFTLFRMSGRIFVRRYTDEAYKSECIRPTVKHGGGKIMVWGCLTSAGVGDIVRIEGIMTKEIYYNILKNHMRPSMNRLGGKENLIFQQDNDPKHTAIICRNYLNNNGYRKLEPPSQSPDLNPIENLWWYLEQQLARRVDRATSLESLFDIVRDEWKKMDSLLLKKYIRNMPKRLQAVIDAQGGHTKY